jgi:hypothetical protein
VAQHLGRRARLDIAQASSIRSCGPAPPNSIGQPGQTDFQPAPMLSQQRPIHRPVAPLILSSSFLTCLRRILSDWLPGARLSSAPASSVLVLTWQPDQGKSPGCGLLFVPISLSRTRQSPHLPARCIFCCSARCNCSSRGSPS